VIEAEERADLSAELEEARREMRKRILQMDDPEFARLYYRAITLSEHEAARRALMILPPKPRARVKR
jgi:hypothetical protein